MLQLMLITSMGEIMKLISDTLKNVNVHIFV